MAEAMVEMRVEPSISKDRMEEEEWTKVLMLINPRVTVSILNLMIPLSMIRAIFPMMFVLQSLLWFKA